MVLTDGNQLLKRQLNYLKTLINNNTCKIKII